MCVLPLLSVLSLCCQGKAVVKYPGNSHLEQLCLYTLTIAEPGERKSGCFQEFMRPLREYERRYNELHKAEIDDYNTHRAFLQQRINNELKGKNGSLEKAKEYRKELRELEEVQSMKLTLTDATPEALVRELHNHGEAIGIMGDEGTILSILGGVYSKGGVNYVVDCYNAAPDSMRSSISMLDQVETDGMRYCILADMLELGERSSEFHKTVGKYVSQSNADRLYCYGELARNYIIGAVENGFDKNHCMHFSDRDELADYLKGKLKSGDSVLLKGSRGMALEEVFKAL